MSNQSFIDAYLECAIWSSEPDSPQSERKLWNRATWSQKAIDRAKADCEAFLTKAQPIMEEAMAKWNYSDSQAGHDFWLTRNGHGAGFWDRDELKKDDEGNRVTWGDDLTKIAKGFRETVLYAGDDGLFYFTG